MTKIISNFLVGIALLIITGCSVLEEVVNDHTLLTGVAAYKATTTIIEAADDPAARAGRIIRYTEAAIEVVDSSTPATLESLYFYVHGLVMAQVPDIDRQPAEDMLDALRKALAEEIDEFAVLTPETEVSLLHIITRIRSAAELYV